MSANFYQSMLRIQETVQLAEDQRLNLTAAGATGFLVQEAAILSDAVPLDPFNAAAYNQAEAASRGAFSTALTSFGGEFAAVFAELAKVISPTGTATGGVPAVAPTAVLPQLYLFMANAAASPSTAGFSSPPVVNSRNVTRNTVTAAGSNVGTGAIYRLLVDRFGNTLEGDFAETTTFLCTADNPSGTLPGQEQFLCLGQPFRDALSWFSAGYGSGLQLPAGLTGVTGDTTTALIQNPSFSSSSGSGGTFALTSWTQTSGVASSMQLDTANYYRACALEGSAPASLQVSGSVTITQLIAPNNTSGQLALAAYLNQLAWNGQIGTWSGSITVQIGSKSWSVSSGATGWQTLRPALDKDLWAQNFEQANLAVTITITVTGGSVRIDDFCWAPFTVVGSKLFWPVGGRTNWLANDSFTVSDVEPNPPSKVQNWIRLMFPGYFLPSIVMPAAPATACTAVQSATGGATTAGAHKVWISFVNATGESGLSPASNVVVVDGAHKVDLSAIPTGPGGTTKRRAYMSKANDVGPAATPYFVADVAGNVSTTATIDAADAALLLITGSYGDPVN